MHTLHTQLYSLLTQHIEYDIPYYLEHAREHASSVLELGMGTGRTLFPIAKENIACVGLDHHLEMLQFSRQFVQQNQLPVDVIEADMTRFSLSRQFDQIQLPLRTLQLLTPSQQETCIQSISHHLKKGGFVLIHHTTWDPEQHRGLWCLYQDAPTSDGGLLTFEESTRGTADHLHLRYRIQQYDSTGQHIASWIRSYNLHNLSLSTLRTWFDGHHLQIARSIHLVGQDQLIIAQKTS